MSWKGWVTATSVTVLRSCLRVQNTVRATLTPASVRLHIGSHNKSEAVVANVVQLLTGASVPAVTMAPTKAFLGVPMFLQKKDGEGDLAVAAFNYYKTLSASKEVELSVAASCSTARVCDGARCLRHGPPPTCLFKLAQPCLQLLGACHSCTLKSARR